MDRHDHTVNIVWGVCQIHSPNGSNDDIKFKPAAGLSVDEIALLARDLDTSSKFTLRKFEI